MAGARLAAGNKRFVLMAGHFLHSGVCVWGCGGVQLCLQPHDGAEAQAGLLCSYLNCRVPLAH